MAKMLALRIIVCIATVIISTRAKISYDEVEANIFDSKRRDFELHVLNSTQITKDFFARDDVTIALAVGSVALEYLPYVGQFAKLIPLMRDTLEVRLFKNSFLLHRYASLLSMMLTVKLFWRIEVNGVVHSQKQLLMKQCVLLPRVKADGWKRRCKPFKRNSFCLVKIILIYRIEKQSLQLFTPILIQ